MHAQRLAVARFMERRQRCEARRALRHWADIVAERREHLERLRACIKRKRVAFQQFKLWYWDAFDADVQVGHGGGLWG